MIYTRVSSASQASGAGLQIQEVAGRRWANEHYPRRRLHFFSEVCSGKREAFEQRTAWPALMAELRRRPGAVVVVYRLDRLSRDMVLQEQLLADVVRAGGQLHSASPAEDANLIDDPDDPTRTLIRQVLGAVAQHERAMIRMRMRAGTARKRAAGGYAAGRPPLGYRARGGRLERDPAWRPLIASMRQHQRAGKSLREIAAAVGPRPDGKPFQPQQVARILGRP